ncbi:MAG: putative lipoprotein [Candidatus Peribacter riflensis]|uniref:Putative lipoprotein n=1 Tax=Candidatus Peribacter riflensis TaxID=1735162 RepID=A0A0S1SMU9_9BACT|nr:MAG: putative lipoprotein [Candidatus Peribacter riflensis]ALM10650.1 MAG: putative lipoprotein [Candidatus Peribacter riflensis]ALM11752.1 MAG: putative lipoprotein [Candidatus Peribacter riflensis]ALM12855.1 MAG: putative lipoprotein [Candidatus Peribacter riflensis]ALM13956.1 MAG: putative lipoprotein [Candidatus Peribacter riflensis]
MFPLFLLGLLVSAASAQSEPFLDTVHHPQAGPIEELRTRGIAQGYGNGIFRPDTPINRAEFLKLVTLAVFGRMYVTDTTACFADFQDEVQWYWMTACVAKEAGLIDGYPDGTFRGGQTVNLAEALKMAEMAWQMPLPQYFREPDHWYDPFFDAVADRGIAEYFLHTPGHLLTRGDAAWLLVALGQPLATVEQRASSRSSAFSTSSVSSPSIHGVCGNGRREGTEQCDDGNREDGDGCSSICIIVPETIQHSAIRLDQRSLGEDTRAGGSSQTVLFSFDANARWQDAILTGLKLEAELGALSAAVNYRLYEDVDGDGRPESIVGSGIVREGVLSFSGLDARIFIIRGKRFEIRADLVQAAGSVALGFRTTDSAYVEAVGALDGRELIGIRTDDGGCPRTDNCWIAVYTKESETVTVAERGNLFVREATAPTRSHQLLAGGKTGDLLRLSFRATDEEITVRRLAIRGATDAVEQIEFYDPGIATPFAIAHTSGCRTPATGQFCTSVNFSVHKDIVRDVIVRAVLKPADDGAVSGDAVTLMLTPGTSVSDPAVEATGVASQEDLVQNDGDFSAEGEIFIGRAAAGGNNAIESSTHDVVHSGIASITNAATEFDGAVVPTGLRTFGSFRFRAHEKPATARGSRSVHLTDLTFDVTATSVRFQTGSFVLINTIAPTIASTCTETGITGAFTVTCSAFVAEGVHAIIPFGDYVTLGLRGYIESSKTVPSGTSMLQVSLVNFNDRSAAGSVVWNDGTTTFEWVDSDASDVRSTLYQTP